MSRIEEEITRENWILNTFPEWGTWLNEEIEMEDVKPGTVAISSFSHVPLRNVFNTNFLVISSILLIVIPPSFI